MEEDSNDYDDDEYLTQSPGEEDDSLVKLPPGESRIQDEEEIDIEKLDFNERALLARINSLKRFLPEKY